MKQTITLALFLLFIGSFNSAFSQADEKKVLEEEKKIAIYIESNLSKPLPQAEFKKFIHGFNHDEHGLTFEKLSKEEQATFVESYKKGYLRYMYFQNNPKARSLYKSKPAPMCENGDFEYGNFNLYSGESAFGNPGGYRLGECEAMPVTGIGNYAWTPDNMSNPLEDNFTIVTQGFDPIVAQSGANLSQVNSGTYAARINSPTKLVVPTWQNNKCWPNHGINRLIKTITLQEEGVQDILFTYALVSQFPDHPNQNPVFIARALDANQNEFDRICVVSNPNDNPFFNQFTPTLPGCPAFTVLWKDWTCEKLEVSGNVGDVITLEFIMADCGAGAHYGYAYVDDICIESCDPGTEGSIELNELDPCQELPFDVCGQYTLPILDGQQGTINSITLDILQNGSVVSTLTNPTITGNTFCFTVTENDFPSQSGGYDFRANASFNIANGIQLKDDTHTTPGTNNDFIFDNPECCKIDANVTNIVCNDEGTPDPSDDTWSFDLTVSSPSNDGFWVADSVLTESYAYGETVTVQMGNISDYNGSIEIIIVDKEENRCSTTITVNVPEACSQGCTLEALTSVGSCNDNGTPNDPSDDYYNITLDVFNTQGQSWMVLNSNMNVIHFGNGDENNINLGDNFLVSNQLEWFWVKLNNDPNCFVDVTVLAPESCNFSCNLSANVTTSDCNDNGTPRDPSDDYYYITVDVLGTNGISWQLVGYPNYQQISYSGTGNETNIQFGPISASDPSWVLYITPTGLVDSGCKRYETTVFAPKCSEKKKKEKVTISPNPNKGKMDISVAMEGDSVVELNIHRIDGSIVKTIKKEKTNTEVLTFDLNLNLPKGLYLFNFVTNKGTITKRVLVE